MFLHPPCRGRALLNHFCRDGGHGDRGSGRGVYKVKAVLLVQLLDRGVIALGDRIERVIRTDCDADPSCRRGA